MYKRQLLDVCNTFGFPTSTTVSIVFELLGGAVAVALFKIWSAEPGAAQALSSYIQDVYKRQSWGRPPNVRR